MFQGFSKDGATFLKELAQNNNKEWFAENKKRFKGNLETPAKEFVAAVEDELQGDWKGKIFRIYRDLRFSKDKTPYNTHLRIGFSAPEEVSLFFSLEPDQLILGAGLFEFSKDGLSRLREAISGEEGERIAALLERYGDKGYRLDEPELKRVPRGYPADHPRADLLRRKSLALWWDKPIPKALFTPKALPHCLGVYQELSELRDLLKGYL